MNRILISLVLMIMAVSSLFSFNNHSKAYDLGDPFEEIISAVEADTLDPIDEREGDFITDPSYNPFDLEDPPAITQEVEYDPDTGLYLITEKIGDEFYRAPTWMTFEEYLEYSAEKQQRDYFDQLSRNAETSLGSSGKPDPIMNIEVPNEVLDKLFGGTKIDIRPQGNIDLTLGADYQRVDNPIAPERQRSQGGFDFDMNIQMNVTGQIGEKMKLGTSYNTQATFNFENQMKLEYAGGEDDIIQKIEAGNVSLPLKSTLIRGSQSLFGVKTELRFGRMTLTGIASSQKSRRNEIQLQGGSQVQNFEINADQYDENRHFFFSHYNRDHFEEGLEQLPQIRSLFSVSRLEVWVTNTRNQTEGVRDIVALADLGEGNTDKIINNNPLFQPGAVVNNPDINGEALPTNEANPMYDVIINNPQSRYISEAVAQLQNVYNLQQSKDFEKVRARMLNPNEYTFHPELGFISLNLTLQPEDVLGFAMEYTYNGQVYRIGEFTNDLPINPDTLSVLYVKMLKSTTPRVDIPIWDLMMKNIYSIGAYQVNQEDFLLDMYYEDPGGGQKRFLPATAIEGKPLIQVMNLDNLNSQRDPQPDGRFDYVEGITINSRNGRVMLPKLEPFGSSLKEEILSSSPDPNNPAIIAEAEQYTYQQLYDSTLIRAREFPEFNRYTIRGTYKSSVSSEISLGAFNIPRGSVVVRAGGQILTEGTDYTVDYNIGRIKILNEAYMNSGVPINVSFEDNSLFGFQNKTLLGLRAEYKISDNFNVGGTVMKLYERPFTQKVNIGDDPINNTIYGGDVQYTTEAPWLTRAIDKLPLLQTKAPSQISFMAEAAYLKPNHARAIQQEDQGVVYVDDFEGSTSSIDLRNNAVNWSLASVPQNDITNSNPLFPESSFIDTTLSGVNRAKLMWYQIDQTSINNAVDGTDNPYTEAVFIRDIFPNVANNPNSILNNSIRTLDLRYVPEKRGPYNFDLPDGGTAYSAGLDDDGDLLEPGTRWAGIQRQLTNNNFEASNVEFIEFWMMSPYLEANGNPSEAGDGEMYINLGNVSEDILRDSRLFFENGLPGPSNENLRVDTTSWSKVPRSAAVTRAFDNNPDTRVAQDVGFDGANDIDEQLLYADYVQAIQNSPSMFNVVKQEILADVSNDNFVYYNDEDVYGDSDGIFDRYLDYNNPENNSPATTSGQVQAYSNNPDTEDINFDNTLNETEAYFQYKIPIKKDASGTGIELNEFIVEDAITENGRKWYRFKVPLEEYTSRVGGIQDFRSIRFIRLYMTKFETPVTMRFARFELVRNQWRRYRRTLAEAGVGTIVDENDDTLFDLNEVNIEENGGKDPYNYVLPPGVQREQQVGSAFNNAFQNEQSLAVNVCNLQDGDARGIFKNINLDIRLYKKLKMFVHAESKDVINPGELKMFVRIGSDFERNYYEYEMPLYMTEGILDPEEVDEGDYARAVWPLENELDLDLSLLQEVKTQRNFSNSALNDLYSIDDPNYPGKTVSVKGNPNLGLVKSIMIGVRNTEDDGLPRCAELWFNELRLSGFDERGGWGALARMDIQMADFGNVNLSTNYTSVGFGGIEQKLQQRSREEVIQYDIAGNFELGKFIPEKAGIKIPVYAQYSSTIKNPQYDPYDLDIELKDKLDLAPSREVRDSVRNQAQDFTEIKTVNVTNVRKERTNSKKEPRPWDIENLSLTYAYSETNRHTPIIQNDQLTDQQAIVDYTYSGKPLYIEPFKNIAKDKPKVQKYIKLLTDFNFNPIPNGLGFSTRMHRQLQETTYRFSDETNNTWYNRRFNWDRSYNLKWDLTRSLKFNFNATNIGVIDELDDTSLVGSPEAKEYIWGNIQDWGRNKDYQHNMNASYTLPFKQLPYLDFITVKAQYNANFGWLAAGLNEFDVDGVTLGNIIRNGQTRQITGDLDFVKLYNNSKFLKEINNKRPTSTRPNRFSSNNKKDDKGTDKKDDKKGDDKEKAKKEGPSAAAKAILRPLMLIRKARFSYSEQFSSVVPGFTPNHRLLGMDESVTSPGWDYVFGWRQPDREWLFQNQDWITPSIFMNQQVLGNHSQDINARLTVEPFNDFNIDIEANRKMSDNTSVYFKRTSNHPDSTYQYLTPQEIGSFQISYFSMKTLFTNDYASIFEQFEANREIISQRLANQTGVVNPHDLDDQHGDYLEGYGRYQLDVLIPAFLSAYNGKDASATKLNVFKTIPLPNWRLSYKGLHKIKGLDKIFSSVSITHGYKSGLNINSYNTDLSFDSQAIIQDKNVNTENYYSQYEIPNIVISEQLSPLLGLDMRFKNDLTTRIDWKKSRTLAMGFTDYQLSETRSDEFVVGMGYRLKNVYIAFLDFDALNSGVKKKKKKNKKNDKDGDNSKDKKGSDVNFKFDFSWRNDITINHLLDQDQSIPTRGMKTIRISPSIDYSVNKQLNLRLFYDYSKTIPATSASFPITNTQAGLQIRFSLN